MRTRIVTFFAALLTAGIALAAEHAAEAEAHAPAEDQGSALLKLDHGTAFWTLILFLFLLIVLGKFVWPGIVKGLDAREEKIRGDIEGAEAANKAAKATLADYEKKLAEAHAEARKLVDQARVDAEKVRQRLAGETEAQITQMRQRATAEIAQAKTQAVQELYARAAELSVAVAEKVLQRQINDTDTQSLVEQSLRELDAVKA